MQETDLSFLTSSMKSVLADAEDLRGGAKAKANQAQYFEVLIEQVVIAFREWSRNQGNFKAPQQLPKLEGLLRDTHSTLEQVIEFVLDEY